MEEYKIADFLIDYPNQSFPAFRKVELSKGLEFCCVFATKLGLPSDTDPLTVLERLSEYATFIKHLDPQNFDLYELLLSLPISVVPNQNIYIDWMRFDDIDEMSITDISQYFFDIWYGEDVSLFDATLSWMIFIFHYKAITLFQI